MKNIYAQLFLTFAKIGSFTFGGGIAMLPMLSTELVEKRKWITDDELLDYFYKLKTNKIILVLVHKI